MTTLKTLALMALALALGAAIVITIFYLLEIATRPNYGIMIQATPRPAYQMIIATAGPEEAR